MYIAFDENQKVVHVDNTVPGKRYFCPACSSVLSVRRGEIRHHYFAHMPGSECVDSWERDYDMSDWHRDWQGKFPIKNQEVIVKLGDTVHRADILTGKTVIEFQHSPLSVDSFNKRNAFYSDFGYKVVWLYDLTEEFDNGKISYEIIDGAYNFTWKHPRTTFREYCIGAGRIEMFFQIRHNGENSIVKVVSDSSIGFSSFRGVLFDVSSFLAYFQTSGGGYPEPWRKDLVVNSDYLAFKEKYGIRLDSQQERAVETVDGAVLLLAVPGSGKTTTLISRLGYMVKCRNIKADNILALTYTKNAAEDMVGRYRSFFGNDDIKIKTINSLADEIIRKYIGKKSLIENNKSAEILKKIYIDYKGEYPTPSDISSAAVTITYIKNMMLSDDEKKGLSIWDCNAKSIFDAYQEKVKQEGLIDFDDQLILAFDILKNNHDALTEMQSRYKYICVDEAQDTSKLQFEMIKAIVGKNNNVFMVGDEDQSIYHFRAAYPEGLLNFREEYPNPFIQRLETNYRSTNGITELASEFIACNRMRYPKKMIASRGNGNKPQCIVVEERDQQYQDIINRTKNDYGKTAYLYRNNVCAIPLADRFFKENIKFTILKNDTTMFFKEHEVNDIKSFFALSFNNRDTDAFKRIYYKCGLGIKKNEVNGICGKVWYNKKNIYEAITEWYSYGSRNKGYKGNQFKQLIEPLTEMKPYDAISHIYDNGYGDYLLNNHLGGGDVEILKMLAKGDDTVQSFLNHLDQLEKKLGDLGKDLSDSVIFSSIHSSKGLEYDNVYIMDIIDGLFPAACGEHVSEEEQFNVEQEERRLFYVAMTRARDNLYFYRIANESSSYLDELFPVGGKQISRIFMRRKEECKYIKNLLTQKTYMVKAGIWNDYSCKAFDPETGEILDENPEEFIKTMDLKVWAEIKE